jgi:hypothetical protein
LDLLLSTVAAAAEAVEEEAVLEVLAVLAAEDLLEP